MPHASNRPLSPHLQVYRWQLTMLLSITHRATGISLSIGSVLLAGWLIAAAMGQTEYTAINSIMSAWYGRTLMVLWSYAMFYHLCNGIRHLGWDTGWGLDLRTTYLTGYATVAVSLLLTAAVCVFALT